MSDEPNKPSWSWIGWGLFLGLLFLYLLTVVVVLSFDLGVCATEAIVETFWPRWDNVIWIRVAGGIAALVVLAFGIKVAAGTQWGRRVIRFVLRALVFYPVSLLVALSCAWLEHVGNIIIYLMLLAVLSLGVFLLTRNRRTKPALYTVLVVCAIAVVLFNFVIRAVARMTA
jgi:hypothetical protein